MARLDRLLTAKGIAQLGAVLGRQFSFELLQAVSHLDAATLQRELHQLVEAEFLHQHGSPPQAHYMFKHVLIQEAAYQSLLKRTRQQYQGIGQILAGPLRGDRRDPAGAAGAITTPKGLIESAIVHWQLAGERAVERSAHVEAVMHLTRGLEVLQTLPDTPQRAQQELHLQTALGPALIATKGYAASEVEHTYARARALCQQSGETPGLFSALRGLWVFNEARAEYQTARQQLAEQLLTLAQTLQDPCSSSRPIGRWGIRCSGLVSSPLLAPIWSRGWRSTTRNSTAPSLSSTGLIPGSVPLLYRLGLGAAGLCGPGPAEK